MRCQQAAQGLEQPDRIGDVFKNVNQRDEIEQRRIARHEVIERFVDLEPRDRSGLSV